METSYDPWVTILHYLLIKVFITAVKIAQVKELSGPN